MWRQWLLVSMPSAWLSPPPGLPPHVLSVESHLLLVYPENSHLDVQGWAGLGVFIGETNPALEQSLRSFFHTLMAEPSADTVRG